MALYDGVVTLADDDIPVIVELDEDRIRLSASGTEIGEWRAADCRISHVADSVYTISAEDETLQFVPSQPGLFAAAVDGNGHRNAGVSSAPSPDKSVVESAPSPKPEPTAPRLDGVREAPPPKPLTMGLFYGLCFLTGALGIWALISMIF